MNLQERYDRDTYLEFLRTFVPGFKQDVRDVIVEKLQVTSEAHFLGESEDLDLSVFEITHSSSADARVSLSMDGFKLMKTTGTYRTLMVYRSKNSDDWRFSLMTATPDLDEKGKVVRKLSNPRRYSFFLGPSAKINTPTRFLIKQGPVIDFADLQSRFSLEVVNKEFYKQISEKFTQLVGGTLGIGKKQKTYEPLIKLPSQSEKSRANMEFGVRLIGRIIFCWFLREKKSKNDLSLMPKTLLSLESISKHPHYYHSILEPIFFEVLNKEHKSRREEFSGEQYSLVPYLNGGLFSPHADDYYKRPNGEQSIYHNTLVIPDQWLKELFEILETYNFTIDENTSFDEELSIDPEMLGRIFENLLAEINPETGESARKSTGSYYTPRVIVDYMVDESLFLYLQEHTKIPEDKLRVVISYDLSDDVERPLTEDERRQIVETLGKLKLLDPACGSGAFPIGALQKIVFILQQIDPEGKLWLQKQLENAHPEFRRDIEKRFSNRELDFLRKLGIIRECIFGVDIQPIATEIARLRCFLTLIVDERIEDDAENRGIKPLPNLDFKFVTANSLIDLPKLEETVQIQAFDNREGINELKIIRDQYFNAYGIEREQLKTQFVTAQKRLVDQLIDEHGYIGVAKAELTQKLASWEPFSHRSTPWFDPEWMFGTSSFDITIANPPYIDSEEMVKSQKEARDYIAQNYELTKGNWDIYIAFFEFAFKILNSTGILTFITPDKWIAKSFGDELRIKKVPENLVSVFRAGRDVFDSVNVDSIVTIFTNNCCKTLELFDTAENKIFLKRRISKDILNAPFYLDILFSSHLELLLKIESQKQKLNNRAICENACATSDAYLLKNLISDLKEKDAFDEESQLKIINTGTVGRYVPRWGAKSMTYLKDKYLFPITNKTEFNTTFNESYRKRTASPKLIIKGLTLLDACIDIKGSVVPGKSTLVVLTENKEELKLLLGIINSKLMQFYLNEKYSSSSYNGGINFTKDMINALPIPEFSQNEEESLINLVDEILLLTEQKEYDPCNPPEEQQSLERKIDNIVFASFALTPEEVKIVENSGK